MSTYTVTGHITNPSGQALNRLSVRAYDVDLRQRQLLGETQTNRQGEYTIHYTTEQLVRSDKQVPDLLIEVLDAGQVLLGQSDIQFRAASETTVDIILAAGKYTPLTEFDDLTATITPLLERTGLTLVELEEADIPFIAGETGLDKTKLNHFILAHRLAAESGLEAAFWYASLAYWAITTSAAASLITQTERILAIVPSIKTDVIQVALEKAVRNNDLAADFPIQAALQQFQTFAVEQSDRLETVLKNALVIAHIPKGKRAELMALLLENPSADAVRQKLAEDQRFTSKEKTDLETVLRLAALTDNDMRIVEKLKKTIGTKGEKGLRELAGKSAEEWNNLLTDTAIPKNVVDSSAAATPLATVARQFAANYPTAAFTGALSRHVAAMKQPVGKKREVVRNDQDDATLGIFSSVLPFLDNHGDFDLLTDNVDTLFEGEGNNTVAKKRSLTAVADTTQLKSDLKTIQRVFRLRPTFDATKSLLEKDLHSAQKIYSMGEGAFVRDLKNAAGFNERTARTTFQQAANTHAAVLTMIAEWRDAQEAQSIAALQTTSARSASSEGTRAILPNLPTLFGSADVCECDHCSSVLSPSAYLMDMITFLKNRKAVTPGRSAWDILKKRRPDLGFLEMSCDNTNVPLPYIDLVSEVLEEAAAWNAPRLRSVDAAWACILPLSNEANLTKGLAAPALKTALAGQQIFLSDVAVVSARQTLTDRNTYDCWIVRDTNISLKVVKRPSDLAVAVLRQTRGAEDWLAATPQYIYPKVYSQGLSVAAYPMNFPFPLFLEETRALMGRAGVLRWELMETMLGPGGAARIAPEYFNSNGDFWTATPAVQFQYWGEQDNNALVANASKVSVFLQKTGLEYTDLLRLLDLKWVNPKGKAWVDHTDTSCDTDKKIIRNTDPTLFDRILKMLQFSKLAGWELWETDLVLRHPALETGKFNLDTIILLWQFARLQKQLNVNVEQALVLLGDMNTDTHFTDAYAPRRPGLYQTVFLNPRNTPPAAFDLAKVTTAPDDLIANHKVALQAALQLKEAELDALLQLERLDGTPFLAPDAALSLGNLSFLYRNVLLARSFQLPSVAAWATFIRMTDFNLPLDYQAAFPTPNPWLSQANLSTLLQQVAFFNGGFFDLPELNDVMQSGPNTTADKVAFLTTLMKTIPTLADADLPFFLIQQLSEKLELSLPLTEYILTNFQFGRMAGGAKTPFLRKDQPLPLTDLNFRDGFQVYARLQQLALIIKKLKINLIELQALHTLQNGNSLFSQYSFDPLNQPLDLRLLSYFKNILDFNRFYAHEKISFLAIQSKIKANAYVDLQACAADLALLFNAEAAEVAFLLTEWAIPQVRFVDLALVQRVEKVVLFAQKLHVSTSQLKELSGFIDERHPALLKQSLSAFYGEKQWLGLLKTVQDELRERKREALVAFLLTLPPPVDIPSGKWETANDLYAYYLMDVEMTSAQTTSRIVHAAGSIQLFVQRCLMGLEPEIIVDTEGTDADMGWLEWPWMKNYRVWEANRKVFLYPENWIEPELRRDKSPIFKELESELSQNELNRENVETAFLNYLEKLQDVAQLEPMGHTWEEETNTFHVFARTAGEPHTYYYRKFVESRRWSAWVKVPLDIQHDYLVPFVRNGQLYLFWAHISEAPVENGNLTVTVPKQDAPYTMERPVKQVKLQLAYSQLKNGKWTPKKISTKGVVMLEGKAHEAPKSNFFLQPFIFLNTELLVINCYIEQDKALVLKGVFSMTGCQGAPELQPTPTATRLTKYPRFSDGAYRYMKAVEPNFSADGDSALTVRFTNLPPATLLKKTGPGSFEISETWQPSVLDIVTWGFDAPNTGLYIGSAMPYFFRDAQRVFWVYRKFVNPATNEIFGIAPLAEWAHAIVGNTLNEYVPAHPSFIGALASPRNFFYPFYHPLICLFVNKIYNEGIGGLMKRSTQGASTSFDFAASYQPTPEVDTRYPIENVDFTPDGSYSLYNWELFFHAPLMVATRLAKDQKFEEAINWFHYIFNPLDPTPPNAANPASKYWITKPFFERQRKEYDYQRIDTLLKKLAGDPSVAADDPAMIPPFTRQEIENQVTDWRKHPFEPHVIAEYRTVAYQKTVIMKYLDTLIARGDQLYRRDTMEDINEATHCYVIAAEILGPRARRVPPAYRALPETFHELEAKMDRFSNSLVAGLENLLPAVPTTPASGATPTLPNVLYFCLPQNDILMSYWDTVANRLYNIRHGLNIEGVRRSLALFAPVIDPAALVRAVAGGASISSVLADLNAPLPPYRFAVALQKANELCNDVKALGGALLAVLEKRDGEKLSLLRQTHETALLEVVKLVKTMQIDDAKLVLEGLDKNRQVITLRRDYYASREFINRGEKKALDLNIASTELDAGVAIAYGLSAVLKFIPNFIAGVSGIGGSPTFTVQTGGQFFGGAAEDAAKIISATSHVFDKQAGLASTMGSYKRRQDDWKHQTDLANKELEQIEKSIAGAQLKISIAEQELKNHELQVTNAHAMEAYMKTKYTNRELYEWQLSQITPIYFQSYQLAFDWAKKAERCYEFELGVTGKSRTSIVQFGHWDSLYKGLMSGEKLQLDLRRLEAAYWERNRREFEITKHISLRQLNPWAVLQLKETGKCEFDLSELLFDLDFPGHYKRRIKSVSISIPCVAGPYTNINATLRLLQNKFRNTAIWGKTYLESTTESDERFSTYTIPIAAIAASTAQNDGGLFELNFKDERYLPFEGAGATSQWRLELPELRQFDYDTISDVVVHLRYTAMEGGESLKKAAFDAVMTYLQSVEDLGQQEGLFSIIDLQHDLPTEWHKAMQMKASGQIHSLDLKNVKDFLPYFARMQNGKERDISKIEVKDIWLIHQSELSDGDWGLKIGEATPIPFGKGTTFGNTTVSVLNTQELKLMNWTLSINKADKTISKAHLLLRFILKK